MKTHSQLHVIAVVFIIIGMAVLKPVALIGQWQARAYKSQGGEEITYMVKSDLQKYRYDILINGTEGVVIIDPASETTAILMPEKKMVHYTDIHGPMSRTNDPVQGYNAYLAYGEEITEGKEEKEGYECSKNVLYQGGEKLFTRWFSDELNFPVRIEAHFAEDQYMQLTDIEEWDVDPEFFRVPDDYVEVDEELRPVIPAPAPPEEWTEKEVAFPVDMTLSRGVKISIPVEVSDYYRMIIENNGDVPVKFSYHILNNGVELPEDEQGPLDYRTKRLHMGDDFKMTFDWKAGWTIMIKCYEGAASLKMHPE